MSIEIKSEKEKIQELDAKIHSLKMEKLLKIEYITTETKHVVEALKTLDGRLKNAEDKLEKCESKDIRRWSEIIKCIGARRDVLTGFKQVLHECRLSITLLMKEENQLTFRKLKLESGE